MSGVMPHQMIWHEEQVTSKPLKRSIAPQGFAYLLYPLIKGTEPYRGVMTVRAWSESSGVTERPFEIQWEPGQLPLVIEPPPLSGQSSSPAISDSDHAQSVVLESAPNGDDVPL